MIPSIAQLAASAARTAKALKQEAEAPARVKNKASHLHTIAKRAARDNRAKIIDWLKTQTEPVSAEKTSDALGISRETTRRHLIALGEEGLADVTRTRSGWNRYLLAANRKSK